MPSHRTISLILILLFCVNIAVNCHIQFSKTPNAELVLISENNQARALNLSQTDSNWTPVLFWHGMGDTAKGSITIDRLALEKKFPGIQVYSIQIGKNMVEDELAGYLTNVNQQVQQACEQILTNQQIRNAGRINAVGFSQGAQFLRALVQSCPLAKNGIQFKNLISLGGQHQGVFGLPNCNTPLICEYVRQMLSEGAYEKDIQEHLVQAEYWHDPLHEQEYRRKNVFLAEINNENGINQTYRNALINLDSLVLVKFAQDEMVVPRESSHFEFYEPGQTTNILPLEKSPLWMEDRLGLKELRNNNKLVMLTVPGRHLQYHMSWFLQEIAEKYLNN